MIYALLNLYFLFPFVKGVTMNKQVGHSSSEAWLISINRQGSHCIPRHNTLYSMKDNTTKMKCVSFPLDVFGKFRSAEPELAGEAFQFILNYVIDGEQKHFTDPYKEMLFESLPVPIRPQMTRYSERAEQCQELARERKKSQKTSRKKNVKVAKENENVDDGNVIDANANEIVNTTDDNVTVDNAGVNDADDNVTSTNDNVEPVVEDVSFTTFMSIYEHQDKGGFDTESVWNRLSDDDKRDAIRYARQYVDTIPDVAKREWPSRFLTSRPWLNNTKA